jgi:DNA polymerase III delta subunit
VPRTDPLDRLLERAAAGEAGPVYVVSGDRVLSEPAAERLAAGLAAAAGCPVETHKRPTRLSPILADLKTYSLFSTAKVVLAVETGVLADRQAAATFVDQAADVLPLGEGADLSPREHQAAVRLVQAVRLFDLDPYGAAPEAVLSNLPDWVFKGGETRKRARSKKQAESVQKDLALLLERAALAEIEGFAEDEVSGLAAAARGELPDGHALVLAESSVAPDHPVVQVVRERESLIALSEVKEGQRGGWDGLSELAAELGRQTRMPIARDALAELARRTLQKSDDYGSKDATADSTSRLAAEYRKLAEVAAGRGAGEIDRDLVLQAVEDRGEEDVFQILDAIGEGKGAAALDSLGRYLASGTDQLALRLRFFALLAGFCTNLTAIAGMMVQENLRPGVGNYGQFKSALAPRIQKGLQTDGGGEEKNPLSGLHPYRLHRAYMAASRMNPKYLGKLPWRVLETEIRLKGDSGDPDAALSELVAELAEAARR